MALGAVYAWSVFRVPLAKQFGWSISEVTLTFTISIFVLGIAAFFGGLWLNRKGPRIVALTGGFLYGVGGFLASFSDHRRAARDVAGLGPFCYSNIMRGSIANCGCKGMAFPAFPSPLIQLC
jgi:MFS family permease